MDIFLNELSRALCLAENYVYMSSRIFDNVIAKWAFCVEQFFSAKNYLQSSYYKN